MDNMSTVTPPWDSRRRLDASDALWKFEIVSMLPLWLVYDMDEINHNQQEVLASLGNSVGSS